MYKILIHENAHNDLQWFRQNDRTAYMKVFDLLREISIKPREGTGKPERLKHFEKEVYSRRVNQKDRIIYTIYEALREIDITSCRGHYS